MSACATSKSGANRWWRISTATRAPSHPEVDWKGWKDFRNLTTHVYWRADATIAAEAMERAIPIMVAVVATELPAAASAAGVDPAARDLSWSLAAVGEQPDSDEQVQSWWRKQRR